VLALKTNLTCQSSVPAADLFLERTVCPICASAKLYTLFSAPYTNANVRSFIASHYRNQGIVNYDLLKDVQYTVHECASCALIFQRMIPTSAMLDIVYNQFIDQAKLKQLELSKLSTDNFREVGRRLGDLFGRIGKEPRDIRMLDFGFGYGRYARVALAMGAQVFATEISPEKIAFARSIGVIVLPENDLLNHRFDVVHTEQVFEHLTDPLDTFDILSQCVARDGVFKIAVPKQGRIRQLLHKNGLIDWSPFEFDYKRSMVDYSTIVPLEHINSFGRKSIEYLAKRGNFSIEIGSFGSQHLDIDVGSVRLLATSCRQWGVRLAKDLYVRCGPGVHDNSYYLLFPLRK
jgi:SAM-dependent methyltransferase